VPHYTGAALSVAQYVLAADDRWPAFVGTPSLFFFPLLPLMTWYVSSSSCDMLLCSLAIGSLPCEHDDVTLLPA